MRTLRSGFSLLELLVVITIVALVVGLVSTTWTAPGREQRTLEDSVGRAAAATATTTVVRDSTRAGVIHVAAYPDGRVVADSSADVQ